MRLSPLKCLQGLRHTLTDKDVGRACGKIGQVRSAFGEAYNTLKAYPLSAINGNILGSILGLSSKVGSQHPVVCSGYSSAVFRQLDIANVP